MNKSSQAANLPQAANRPTLTGEGLTVRIPFPSAGESVSPGPRMHRPYRGMSRASGNRGKRRICFWKISALGGRIADEALRAMNRVQ